MKKFALAVLLGMIYLSITTPSVFASSGSGQSQLIGANVTPLSFQTQLKTNDKQSFTVTVSNPTQYVGHYIFSTANLLPHSVSGGKIALFPVSPSLHINIGFSETLSQTSATINPGASTTVTMTITTSSSISSGDHYIGLLVSSGGNKPNDINIVGEIDVPVIIRALGSTVDTGAITAITESPAFGLPVSFHVTFTDTGNTNYPIGGRFDVYQGNSWVGEGWISVSDVFPNAPRTILLRWTTDKIPFKYGNFVIKVRIYYGIRGEHLATATLPFSIVPIVVEHSGTPPFYIFTTIGLSVLIRADILFLLRRKIANIKTKVVSWWKKITK